MKAIMQLQHVRYSSLFQFMLIHLGKQIKCIPSSIAVIAVAVFSKDFIILHSLGKIISKIICM